MYRGPCPRMKTAARTGYSPNGASAFSTIQPYPDEPLRSMGGAHDNRANRVETPALRMWTVSRDLLVTSITNFPRGRASGPQQQAAAGGLRNGRDGVHSEGEDCRSIAHSASQTNDDPTTDVFHKELRHV